MIQLKKRTSIKHPEWIYAYWKQDIAFCKHDFNHVFIDVLNHVWYIFQPKQYNTPSLTRISWPLSSSTMIHWFTIFFVFLNLFFCLQKQFVSKQVLKVFYFKIMGLLFYAMMNMLPLYCNTNIQGVLQKKFSIPGCYAISSFLIF